MYQLMFDLQVVVLMCCAIVFSGDHASVHAKTPKETGLYSNEDDVIILNKNDFKNLVYNKEEAWVIEFYSTWCGHCKRIAPTWKKFASDLKDWRRVVSVGAVDCGMDENLGICRDFDIDAYPSAVFIPPFFSHKVSEGRLRRLKIQDKKNMKNTVLQLITNPEFSIPSSWPQLQPLKKRVDIWKVAKAVHKWIILVLEEEHSVVGKEVILDLLDYPEILVQRMLKEDVKKFGVVKYPSVYIINRDSSFKHLISGTGTEDSDRRRFVDKLLSMMGWLDAEGRRLKVSPHLGQQTGAQAGGAEQQGIERGGSAKEEKISRGIHMEDMESALLYAFRHEVAVCKIIDGPKLDALRNFVTALAKYFPGRNAMTRYLHKLSDYLGRQVDLLTGLAWEHALDNLQEKDAFLPKEVGWVGCQGSQLGYRGFPCGMWTLFHTLTVAAVEQAQNALEVPKAICGYVEHFFGCKECSHNFVKTACNLETKIHEPIDAVVWLWASHNRVNRRLHGDASEDPLFPKIQFPSAQDCPKCRPKETSDPGRVAWWNLSAVKKFLLTFYSRENIHIETNIDQQQAIKQERNWALAVPYLHNKRLEGIAVKHDAAHRISGTFSDRVKDGYSVDHNPVLWGAKFSHTRGGWSLSQLDMGMYLLFYVACTAIIVFTYCHVCGKKRCRDPCEKLV